MSMKTNLGLAALAVVALLVAGIAYWALRENSQLVAPSGSVAPQGTAPPAAPASQSASTAPPSQATAPPAPDSQSASTAPQSQATAPLAPAPAAPSSPAVIAQSNQLAASTAPSPAAPPNSPANAEPGKPPVPPPATPATQTTKLPAEDQMSEADRRQIQKMLQSMKYYQGPIDGKFGPMTRAAIRRYQDSIGEKSTGYLTAEEATRLASTR
jgi:hypothetical protein